MTGTCVTGSWSPASVRNAGHAHADSDAFACGVTVGFRIGVGWGIARELSVGFPAGVAVIPRG